jgi:hypothetical protein
MLKQKAGAATLFVLPAPAFLLSQRRQEVNRCFLRLGMLIFPWDKIQLAILFEPGAGLLKIKGHARFPALVPDIQNPFESAQAGIGPGFPADGHFLDAAGEIGRQIDVFQYRFADNALMPDRFVYKDGKPEIRAILILDGAADRHIFIPGAPIIGQALVKTVDPLCDKKKVQILSCPDHTPCFCAPAVRILQKEVGGKASVDRIIPDQFVFSCPVALQRQIEVLCLFHNRAVSVMPGIDSIHITVLAAGADFMAPVPGIPLGQRNSASFSVFYYPDGSIVGEE